MVETKFNASKGFNSTKWLIGGIMLLVLAVVGFSLLNHFSSVQQEGRLVIKAGDGTLGSFTVADLQKLPAVEKKMVVQTNCSSSCSNNSANSSEHDYTGTLLLGVLDGIDPGLTRKYTKIIARGVDYYSQVLDMSEVMQPDNVYIVYADHGKPLITQAGGEGSMQLIICNDKTGQRFTKWLVSLELQ
ncbi:hypothetical protein Dtox_3490 [Desulfofarcimen acetoxidans DSM 771]|uniref:Oxidoreductase molybdopterin-binding domain-containing protein n=1 Tax=Desulfofarcimen acetoxidans (strain ATCC 49208 / DSM 771 / KCTC 5769 / VKM B-1644 / 5575) TaxID=485916 RepID=C8W6V0_DESAS|nr:molybdopterin-dependent oxidoreductase [Desulfofarcimen acetoxidans]ACV64209.1 hypothetical protein Dtox_3490 [Desulfofarcimen acetoxidans DSM 771]